MSGRSGSSSREPIPSVEHPILVVEDNELNRAVAGRQLGRLGLRFDFAEDGEQGLTRATTETYAAILTDLSMPVMDGFEFATRYRAWEQAQANSGRLRTPVIAVTANVTPDDMARCRDVGMDDFMSKPVTLGRLREILSKWLSGDDDNAAATPSAATEPGPSAAQTGAIDLKRLGEQTGTDDVSALSVIIQDFLDSAPARRNALAAALEDGATERARTAVLMLGHAARDAALPVVGEVLDLIGQHVQGAAFAAAKARVQDLDVAIQQVREDLEARGRRS